MKERDEMSISGRTKRYLREMWDKVRTECLKDLDPKEGFSDTWY
jgi:hypothetical protein